MENKFLYPVSVQVNTKEDSDRIRRELESFGYKTMTFGSNRMPCIIATNVGSIPDKYTNFFSPDVNIANGNDRYYCFDNIELFLALAAMRDGEVFYPGEIVFYYNRVRNTHANIGSIGKVIAAPQDRSSIDIEWLYIHSSKGSLSSQNDGAYYKGSFRKATKEEIINHYSPKSQQNKETTMTHKDIKVGDKFRITQDVGSRDKKGDIIEIISISLPTYWYKTINRPEEEESFFTTTALMYTGYIEPYVETDKVITGYKLFGVVKTREEWEEIFGAGVVRYEEQFEPVLEWEVKKGDYLYCHTDFIMNDGDKRATKGKVYICEDDGYFTNDVNNKYHSISSPLTYEHFRPATPEEIKTFKTPIIIDGRQMEIAEDGTFGFGCRKEFTYQDAISYQKLLKEGLTIQSPNGYDIDIELLNKIINNLPK